MKVTPGGVSGLFALALLGTATHACATAEAPQGDLPQCVQSQLIGYAPQEGMVPARRQFIVPHVDYPAGTKPDGDWGWEVTVRVNPSGQVVCYKFPDGYRGVPIMNRQREDVIRQLPTWRYAPFLVDGVATAAIVTEAIREQESVVRHLPLPRVAADKVHIALLRTACYGRCPIYQVDIYGDGRVVYDGRRFVNVLGKHTTRVGRAEVAKLVERLRVADIWSMRAAYVGLITDAPTYYLTLEMGAETHLLQDYVGAMAGMPGVVSEFEDAIDEVAKSDQWLHLAGATVDALIAERFNFQSSAGRELLRRAMEDEEGHDDQAILRVMELALPLKGGAGRLDPVFLEEALRNRRASLIDPLIARGALDTKGEPDQKRIDAAFLAAIEGGQVRAARRIWEYAGTRHQPSLTFDSESDDKGKPNRTRLPVSLSISKRGHRRSEVGMRPIVEWLHSLGCDLKAADADGDTLLHFAASRGDLELVRYLLEQGLDAAGQGRFHLTPLGSANDEAVAMLLLDGGGYVTHSDEQRREFRTHAQTRNWLRVLAWLDAHQG